MSPEDMLKSLAVQGLGKWTGLTHLLEMQRVEMTARAPALSSVVRAVIQQARLAAQAGNQRRVPEEIAESSPNEPKKTVRRPLAKDQGMAFVPGRRIRARGLELVA